MIFLEKNLAGDNEGIYWSEGSEIKGSEMWTQNTKYKSSEVKWSVWDYLTAKVKKKTKIFS